MTLSELKTALEGVNSGAFTGKVAYRAFPVGAAPALPFICILETETSNFFADAQVYKKVQGVDIEFYSAQKDTVSEAGIEAMLDSNKILWDKSEYYIDSQNMLQVVYDITI